MRIRSGPPRRPSSGEATCALDPATLQRRRGRTPRCRWVCRSSGRWSRPVSRVAAMPGRRAIADGGAPPSTASKIADAERTIEAPDVLAGTLDAAEARAEVNRCRPLDPGPFRVAGRQQAVSVCRKESRKERTCDTPEIRADGTPDQIGPNVSRRQPAREERTPPQEMILTKAAGPAGRLTPKRVPGSGRASLANRLREFGLERPQGLLE